MLRSPDIDPLFKFHQINRRSREIVDSLPQYQRILSHRLNLFRALLRSWLAICTSLLDFHQAPTMCQKLPFLRGTFWIYISVAMDPLLLQMYRAAPETQVQTLATAQDEDVFRLTRTQLSRLGVLETLPGRYKLSQNVYRCPVNVVSAHQFAVVARQTRLSLWTNMEEENKFTFMASRALPYYDRRARRVEDGMSYAGCRLCVEKRPSTLNIFSLQDRVYTEDGFLDHFRWCAHAQLRWKSSGEGRNPPAELPVSSRIHP